MRLSLIFSVLALLFSVATIVLTTPVGGRSAIDRIKEDQQASVRLDSLRHEIERGLSGSRWATDTSKYYVLLPKDSSVLDSIRGATDAQGAEILKSKCKVLNLDDALRARRTGAILLWVER